MSESTLTGGAYSYDGLNFEHLVYNHLQHIFPKVERDTTLPVDTPLNINIDLLARSHNERLLLFQVKYLRQERRLPNSFYLTVAALKETADRMLPNESPVLTLITNVAVDAS